MKQVVASPTAYQLFHEGSIVLAEVEAAGIRVDTEYLERAISWTESKIRRLQDKLKQDEIFTKWQKVYGQKANLDSPVQLGHMLFNVLGYKCQSYTEKSYDSEGKLKQGARPQVNKAALAKMNIPFLREMEKAGDYKTSCDYLKSIRREAVDSLVHAFFNLTGGDEEEKGGARSYRSSSKSPNLMNCPGRDSDQGKITRQAFIPRSGCRFAEIDFGSHEWNLAACIWEDPKMIHYASDPKADIHRDKAAEMFLCKGSQITKKTRYKGKDGFVFPKLYGSYYKKMAKAVWACLDDAGMEVEGIALKEWLSQKGISELGPCSTKKDAPPPLPGTFEYHLRKMELKFEEDFHVYREKSDLVLEDYRKNGYFRLITGFVVEGLYTKNQILNYLVQGPAFHCLLWCIIRIQKILRKRKMRSLIVSQVHDCVLGDVPEEETQEFLNLTKQVMTVDLPKAWPWIIVPLKAEVDCSPVFPEGNWWNKAPWHEIREGVWAPKAS